MRLRLVLLLCAALALTVGVTAAFSATPITVGQTGAPLVGIGLGGPQELASDGYTVPASGGTIVSLNTQSVTTCAVGGGGTLVGPYKLQVLRPLGGGQYTVLGDTGHQTDPCDGQLHSYPVNIPVQAGDVLGVYISPGGWLGILNFNGQNSSQPGLAEPFQGDTFTLPPSTSTIAIDESATLIQQPSPTSKSDCMNGGWKTLFDNNGNPFKNQGDCVSYVATQGKNPGSG